MLSKALQKMWFSPTKGTRRRRAPLAPRFLRVPLTPLAWTFSAVVSMRRGKYRRTRGSSEQLPVAVVVVGNITVGGSGKTPLVIALVEAMRAKGFTPGVVSRGYGGTALHKREAIEQVDTSKLDASDLYGDEPVLIAMRTEAPVFVGRQRLEVAKALIAAHPEVDLLIADDGLQHYALPRNFEIVVFDGRGIGNGHLLPAGPLREPVDRLAEVDAIVLNGADTAMPELPDDVALVREPFRMTLVPGDAYLINDPSTTVAIESFRGQRLTAAAGIGHPERFFQMLRTRGLSFHRMALHDHYRYVDNPFARRHSAAVLMTEKDAVKCRKFTEKRMWAVPVTAAIDPGLVDAILVNVGASRRPAPKE